FLPIVLLLNHHFFVYLYFKIIVTGDVVQGRTDNSWGPRAIGDHGAPVSLPTLKPHLKKPMKGTRDISWGPLLTPSARVPH
ncbi:unnamed protein product, partial [Staurois parvus]